MHKAEIVQYGIIYLIFIGLIFYDRKNFRLGTNEKNSVVDKNNKVHNITKFYVVDGSSFTTGAGVNPTSRIMALALRAADMIWDKRGEWSWARM